MWSFLPEETDRSTDTDWDYPFPFPLSDMSD